ncbi:MAG: hypothetical protein EAZ99_08005 [Alphaproteobacteria bacterium]|nr:MAG: hypothetical protein EAZ99_08005 [Alphaproteobacteria bacterium]
MTDPSAATVALVTAQPVRRMAVALMADVVGYTRHIARGEATALARLKERQQIFRDEAEVAGGRLVNAPGDSVLLEFPSAQAALIAAETIQAELADLNALLPEAERMQFRIGLDLGDVLAEPDALYGDCVNRAARLQTLAASGGIVVSRAVRDQVRGRVPRRFRDLGTRALKNIVPPVRAYAVEPIDATGRHRPWVIAGLVGFAVVAMAGLGWMAGQKGREAAATSAPTAGSLPAGAGQLTPPSPTVPSTVPRRSSGQRVMLGVAPVSMVGGAGGAAAGDEGLAEGLTEDLIAELSRLTGTTVIARETMFAYRGVDVRQTARDLNLHYIVSITMRRQGEGYRFNVQLADPSGAALWVERYDRNAGDIAALQDEIALQVSRALQLELAQAEGRRLAGRRRDGDAGVLAQRAWSVLLSRGFSPEATLEAQGLAEAALARDPASPLALTVVSQTSVRRALELPPGEDRRRLVAAAKDYGQRAVAADPSSPEAQFALAMALSVGNDIVAAVETLRRVIALNRSHAPAYSRLGFDLARMGEGEEALAMIDRAMELSPRDPLLPVWTGHRLVVLMLLERDEEAAEAARRLARQAPTSAQFHALAAAALWLGGAREEARSLFSRAISLDPRLSLEMFQEVYATASPTVAARRQRIADALIALGFEGVRSR